MANFSGKFEEFFAENYGIDAPNKEFIYHIWIAINQSNLKHKTVEGVLSGNTEEQEIVELEAKVLERKVEKGGKND
jgi:hypothetical protein